MIDPKPSSFFARGTSRRERGIVFAAVAAVLLVYLWSLNGSVLSYIAKAPPGYYGLLTDALTSGQLHLKLEPDPGLAKLANPWAGAQDVPRLHDASYYKGKYFLYFGITPVIVLLGPWHLLTGSFITDGTGTVIFAAIGFLFWVRLWRAMRRSWFPLLRTGWVVGGILMIGLGNYIFFLLQTPVFYHVPIACAYMCIAIALNAVQLALESATVRRSAQWLAAASLFWALCVGARPNYLFSLPVLFGVGVFRLWRLSPTLRKRVQTGWPLLLAVLVPAALIGSGLAWYNYARFGSIREFGVTYQFASIDQRFLNLMNPANIPGTLKSYLQAGATYSPYFPFALPVADVVGIWQWAPFGLLAGLFPFAWFFKRFRANVDWAVIITVAGAICLLHLTSLCLLPFANDRYMVDFLPEAIVVALALCGLLLVNLPPRFLLRQTVRFVFVALGIVTLFHSVLLGLQRFSDRPTARKMAELGDIPAAWVQRAMGQIHGPINLDLTFDQLNYSAQTEPLVVTGNGRDIIYIRYEENSRVRFGFFHEGAGGPTSEPIPIEKGKTYRLTVDLGSLYPPAEHPAFRGWDESLVDALRRRVEIRLDSQPVLHWTSAFYPSDPWHQWLGKNEVNRVTKPVFSGRIGAVQHVGMPAQSEVVALPGDGPVRLTARFPKFNGVVSQPILSTGRPGAGDLIYVTFITRNRLRFGHDSWGGGAVETPEAEYDSTSEHSIEIDLGSLHTHASGLQEGDNRLRIRYDGRLLVSTLRPCHPTKPLDICLGYNATQSTAASPFFTGAKLTGVRTIEFVEAPPISAGAGPIQLTVMLPPPRNGFPEPLLVSGKKGEGDFIYFKAEGENHIRVTLDHWGTGSWSGDPIEVDRSSPVIFTIRTDALDSSRPADSKVAAKRESTPDYAGSVIVLVNGRVALDLKRATYPAGKDEIYIVNNPIGGSTCAAGFSGTLQLAVGITDDAFDELLHRAKLK